MFSQTVEYALRAMMHLATLDGKPQTSDRIAAEIRVPPGYLCKVMRDLVRANLVASFRGPGGGFVLASPPDAITILDVVTAVDPIRRIHKCPIDKPAHADLCPLHKRLDDALAGIECTFRQTTLAEVLASDASSKGSAATPAEAAAQPRPRRQAS